MVPVWPMSTQWKKVGGPGPEVPHRGSKTPKPTGFIYKTSFGNVHLRVVQESPDPCVQTCDKLQKVK